MPRAGHGRIHKVHDDPVPVQLAEEHFLLDGKRGGTGGRAHDDAHGCCIRCLPFFTGIGSLVVLPHARCEDAKEGAPTSVLNHLCFI